MKPVEGANKDVKSSTSGPVDSQSAIANGKGPGGEEKANSNNSSGTVDNSVTASSSPVACEPETDIITNGEVKEESGKGSNNNEPETRGRKMTSVNFLPCDCKLCGEKFNSDKALGYHIRDVHVVGKKDKKEGEGNRKKKPKDYHYVRGKDWKVLNPKRPYCCSICSKRFLYESSLNHHKVVKHNEKLDGNGDEDTGNGNVSNGSNIPPKMYNHTFQCDQCGKILMSKHSLIRHLVSFHGTDHEKPFQCDICGQRYVSISSLVSHRRKEHTGDKPYVCEHCGKAFTMSNRLKCHLRVHSDEKFYKCQQCSKQFKSCSAFRAHKDTHLGVMRHTCKYCERKFLFQGNMIKHIRRRHPNGDKPGNGTGGESANDHNLIASPLVSNNLFTPQGNHNLPIASSGSTTMTIESSNHVVHPIVSTISSTLTSNSVANSVSRRSANNRYPKTADHSYYTKEVTISVESNLELIDQQQSNMQSLSPLDQFVQPEIQFQVLPLSSLPNQELFNGINNYPSTNLNHSNSRATSTHVSGSGGGGGGNTNGTGLNQGQSIVTNQPRDFTGSPTPGKCRLCDQSFSDVRFHINDFHRIPIHKVDTMMPTMVYF